MVKKISILFLLVGMPLGAMSRLRTPLVSSVRRSALQSRKPLFSSAARWSTRLPRQSFFRQRGMPQQMRIAEGGYPQKRRLGELIGAGVAGSLAGAGIASKLFYEKDDKARARRALNEFLSKKMIQARNRGFTTAFKKNDAKKMEYFLDLGIDPDVTYDSLGSFHMGPHTLAEGVIWAHKPVELLKVILDAGADPNQSSSDGTSTPLIAAIMNNDYSAMKLLVERGADIHKRNKPGKQGFMSKSPLERARLFNDQKAIQILLGKDTGVDSNQNSPDQGKEFPSSLDDWMLQDQRDPHTNPMYWLEVDDKDSPTPEAY